MHSFYGSQRSPNRISSLVFIWGSARWVKRENTKLGRVLSDVPITSLLLESDALDQSPKHGERNEPTAILRPRNGSDVRKV